MRKETIAVPVLSALLTLGSILMPTGSLHAQDCYVCFEWYGQITAFEHTFSVDEAKKHDVIWAGLRQCDGEGSDNDCHLTVVQSQCSHHYACSEADPIVLAVGRTFLKSDLAHLKKIASEKENVSLEGGVVEIQACDTEFRIAIPPEMLTVKSSQVGKPAEQGTGEQQRLW